MGVLLGVFVVAVCISSVCSWLDRILAEMLLSPSICNILYLSSPAWNPSFFLRRL